MDSPCRRGREPISPQVLLLHPDDTVVVVRQPISHGMSLHIEGLHVVADRDIGIGHKLARAPACAGSKVIKSGAPIGSLRADVACGDHVHLHNLASDYIPSHTRPGDWFYGER